VTAPREEWHLDTRRLGRRVLVFDCVESTNSVAAALANEPGNDGLAVLAEEQSSGRGQHGRSWTCPRGAGVLMSVLLFPPPELRRPALLTAWAAVSVCETIRKVTNLQATIKWPNDVLIRGRKVCGILIETRSAQAEAPSALHTVCGIGLNVNQTAESFAQAGLPEGGSLALFTAAPLDCRQVARQLIEQLDEEYDRLCQGDLATLKSCWKWRFGLLGKQVIAQCQGGEHRGRLREIGWDALEIEAAGKTLRLRPETVLHIEAMPRSSR